MMDSSDIKTEIDKKIQLIDKSLSQCIPGQDEEPSIIHKAMRYSVFAGGKRLRPVLFLAAVEAVGGDTDSLLPVASALELIHTYSLIHDDLPAMDNDDFRRGKPTSHKKFGEAIAVLTGDALLTLAFELLTEVGTGEKISITTLIKVIKEISAAAGSKGMIGGQVVDLQSENKPITVDTLKYIHSHKTGALFTACVRSGALLGGGSSEQVSALTIYSDSLGLAFQITDDILDIVGDSEKLGKTAGSDERKKKSTYPAIYGLEKSRLLAKDVVNQAVLSLSMFGQEADILRYVANYLLYREK
jgi:geranylgeranyl diphosphate synthase type II